MMLCMAGSVMCSVGVMGCYPLVPAYFAALYLERVSGPVLLGMMYIGTVSYTHLRAHETGRNLVCRLLLEKKKKKTNKK